MNQNNQLKKYKVSILVPYEFYVEANSFSECVDKVHEQMPSNYNGDGIRIEPVGNSEETVVLR